MTTSLPLRGLAAALFLVSAALCYAADPTVSNVRAAQKTGTKQVEISHDVSGSTSPVFVSLQVSTDGGTTFVVPATSLSGQVGAGVTLGQNKKIIWNASGYRLPTEAEWEKATRGGLSGKRFPWGDTVSHSQANYRVYSSNGTTNYYRYDVTPRPPDTVYGYDHPTYNDGVKPYTSPVGSFPANGYGLYDMAGNLHEWCWAI